MKSDSKDFENEVYRLQAEFCKGMANPKRVLILNILKDGEKSVKELVEATGIPQSNLSQHLGLLRNLGLLETRHQGSKVCYSLADMRVAKACELVRSAIAERLRKANKMMEVTK
jgi:DNA-binding transcriptional ArsR family regulator